MNQFNYTNILPGKSTISKNAPCKSKKMNIMEKEQWFVIVCNAEQQACSKQMSFNAISFHLFPFGFQLPCVKSRNHEITAVNKTCAVEKKVMR